MCVLDDSNAPESGEECFKPVTLGDGSANYVLQNKQEENDDTIYTDVKLPDGLTCGRCVLRWTYTAGNNWGQCDDGSYGEGCGPQETFRSCADIAIF